MDKIIACHECDLLLELSEVKPGTKLLCPRCGYVITRTGHQALNRLIAFSLSATLFFAYACAFPFLSFNLQGRGQLITLLQSVSELYQQGHPVLSLMVAIFIILAPLLLLVGLLYVLLPLKAGRRNPGSIVVSKLLLAIQPWSMVEVFLIGVLVSLIKIATMASLLLGPSFWAYVAFSVMLTATLTYLDRLQLWHWLDSAKPWRAVQ